MLVHECRVELMADEKLAKLLIDVPPVGGMGEEATGRQGRSHAVSVMASGAWNQA